jgi:voltage-gated potassium channel Kch
MGPPIGAFALGCLVIASIFAGVFASVWRADSAAFKGLSQNPTLIDFAYYSAMTISTTGYGDVVPQSSAAKILASAEVLIGIAWTVVIFAAVLMVVQRQLQSHTGGRDDLGRE